MKTLKRNIVWSIVEEIRKEFLSKNFDYDSCRFNMISFEDIQNNMKLLLKKLSLDNIPMAPFTNVTEETFQTATKLFIYLNYCPPGIITFYKNLFETQSPKETLLALTSILKSSSTIAKKESAHQIWLKFREYLQPLHNKTRKFFLTNQDWESLDEKGFRLSSDNTI